VGRWSGAERIDFRPEINRCNAHFSAFYGIEPALRTVRSLPTGADLAVCQLQRHFLQVNGK
jgi:hypothetical protein